MIFDEVSGMPLPSQNDFISKLIPNWVSFVAQLAALIIMIIVIIVFAYKPVKKLIEKRQNYIEENIRQSELAKAKANENVSKSEELIVASTKQASEIIKDAKDIAKKQQSATILETEKIIAKMKEDAEKDILQSQLDAKEEIRKEMISIALATSEEILKREVNEKDSSKIADEYIKKLGK